MLEQMTLVQIVTALLTGGLFFVVLGRLVPKWETWQSPLKATLVTAFNLVAGFVLPGMLAHIPAGIGDQTADKLILGVFAAAAAFVIRTIDVWLVANKVAAKRAAGLV